MGCPQKKIVGNGEGCALMADVKRAEKIILAVKKSTDKLVTVKFRKGFGNENTAVEFAKMCEGAGADAITVHGRTSDEMFSGRADWSVIKDVVSAVKIPVFANGDIASREDYLNVKEMTGCFGVSVGRGAMGKPYVFAEISGNDFSFDLMSAIKKHFEILLFVYARKAVRKRNEETYLLLSQRHKRLAQGNAFASKRAHGGGNAAAC